MHLDQKLRRLQIPTHQRGKNNQINAYYTVMSSHFRLIFHKIEIVNPLLCFLCLSTMACMSRTQTDGPPSTSSSSSTKSSPSRTSSQRNRQRISPQPMTQPRDRSWEHALRSMERLLEELPRPTYKRLSSAKRTCKSWTSSWRWQLSRSSKKPRMSSAVTDTSRTLWKKLWLPTRAKRTKLLQQL